jgi:hypothetical protein
MLYYSITAGYKQALYHYIGDTSKSFSYFYNNVFPKWFFQALEDNVIDDNTFKLISNLGDFINMNDIAYYEKTSNKKVIIKRKPSTIRPISITLPRLSSIQQARIDELYTGDIDTVYFLQSLYEGLSGSANFLSVPPIIKEGLIECFGSPFNTSNQYCSAFSIEKKYFKSLGSFFDYKFKSNTNYIMNPPFDELTMKLATVKCFDALANVKNITIIITFPSWYDTESVKMLKNSEYLHSTLLLSKNQYPYFNYYTMKYIQCCDTLLFVITNDKECKYNAKDIAQVWLNI